MLFILQIYNFFYLICDALRGSLKFEAVYCRFSIYILYRVSIMTLLWYVLLNALTHNPKMLRFSLLVLNKG